MRGRKQYSNDAVVHLRLKPLRNGCKRYFIDYLVNGKRHKEYLPELTLVPVKSAKDREHNKKVKSLAEALQAKRKLEIVNGKFQNKESNYDPNLLLVDYLRSYESLKAEKGQSGSLARNVHSLINHLIKYKGKNIKLVGDVDKAYCNGFIDYLATAHTFNLYNKETTKPLKKSTARLYYNTFVCALNRAMRDGRITFNPTTQIDKSDKKPIKPEESNRCFLTVEEVKRLIDTPFRSRVKNDSVKRAFLFSCFCGLRISDVKRLTWGNVVKNGNRMFVSITMKKTGSTALVPLNNNAISWLPERGEAKTKDLIFPKLPVETTLSKTLKRWIKDANINKDVCFHVSRHTFATLELESGANITTVSSLLGHKELSTTMIYAKVVDKAKEEATTRLDDLFK